MKNLRKQHGFIGVESPIILISLLCSIGVVLWLGYSSMTDSAAQKNKEHPRFYYEHKIIVQKEGLLVKRAYQVDEENLKATKTDDLCMLMSGDVVTSETEFAQETGKKTQILYHVLGGYDGKDSCGSGEFFFVAPMDGLSVKPRHANFILSDKPLHLVPDLPNEASILSEALLYQTRK